MELSNKFSIQLFLCSLICNNLEASLEPWIRTILKKNRKTETLIRIKWQTLDVFKLMSSTWRELPGFEDIYMRSMCLKKLNEFFRKG